VQDLLKVWETGQDRHPLDRALILLDAAYPEPTWDELAALSVGERDARLFALRERILGSRLDIYAECPRCGEGLEFGVAVADLLAVPNAEEEIREVSMEGLSVRFRLPDSRDLGAATACQDVDEARALLVRRCVLQAERDGLQLAPNDLPDGAVSELARRMSECDPLAEVLLDLRCPACDHTWQALFDIASFFWKELAAQASRLLSEVHVLARAYGWSEADILGMNSRRRQFYLEMLA